MCLTTFVHIHIFHLLIMCSLFFFLLLSTTIFKCLSIFPLESVINTVTSIQCLSLYLLIVNSNRFSNPLRTISLSRLIRSGEKELFHSLLHSFFYLFVCAEILSYLYTRPFYPRSESFSGNHSLVLQKFNKKFLKILFTIYIYIFSIL